jgi:transposase
MNSGLLPYRVIQIMSKPCTLWSKDRLEARNIRIWPNSPALDLIEQVFAKLKALLYKAAERTYDKRWPRIGKLLDQFQADEWFKRFRHSGDVST